MAPLLARFRTTGLTACPDCDLLQRAPQRPATDLRCARCGATLYRVLRHAPQVTLALMLAAAACFAVAVAFPIVSLDLHGRHTTATLAGMAGAFHDAGMTGVAALVLVTLVVMPAVNILSMLYLLAPPGLGRSPRALGLVSRARRAARPWSMIDVFVLAVLVSIGRLAETAELGLHPAFWALGAMMFLVAAADTVFDEHTYWSGIAMGTA